MPTVRTIRVWHDDTVEIQWTLEDGQVYIERHTIPPRVTRDARGVEADTSYRQWYESLMATRMTGPEAQVVALRGALEQADEYFRALDRMNSHFGEGLHCTCSQRDRENEIKLARRAIRQALLTVPPP